MVPLTDAAAAGSRSRSRPPCRRCSPVPHLPSSPTAKTAQNGHAGLEGTMKLAANLFAALAVLLTAQPASAQSSYPNRPVKILVGFTPGTAPDLAARILADRFSEVWGTPFVVENIPGA